VKRIGAALRRAGGELRAVLRGRVGREGEGRGVERGGAHPFIGRRGKGRRRVRRRGEVGGAGAINGGSVRAAGRGRGGDGRGVSGRRIDGEWRRRSGAGKREGRRRREGMAGGGAGKKRGAAAGGRRSP
jgi:hypothetical protein